MTEVKFTVVGVKGDFFADADELKSYRTNKALAMAERDPASFYAALERIYMGRDAEYVERVGGDVDALAKLNEAAAEAVNVKN